MIVEGETSNTPIWFCCLSHDNFANYYSHGESMQKVLQFDVCTHHYHSYENYMETQLSSIKNNQILQNNVHLSFKTFTVAQKFSTKTPNSFFKASSFSFKSFDIKKLWVEHSGWRKIKGQNLTLPPFITNITYTQRWKSVE